MIYFSNRGLLPVEGAKKKEKKKKQRDSITRFEGVVTPATLGTRSCKMQVHKNQKPVREEEEEEE